MGFVSITPHKLSTILPHITEYTRVLQFLLSMKKTVLYEEFVCIEEEGMT
jgi:hypothetical protein